jgi:hypothetical protein
MLPEVFNVFLAYVHYFGHSLKSGRLNHFLPGFHFAIGGLRYLKLFSYLLVFHIPSEVRGFSLFSFLYGS